MREELILRREKRAQTQDLAAILRRLKAPYVFWEDHRQGKALIFENLIEEIAFYPGDDLQAFWQALDRARQKGWWLAGYWTYEFGYWLCRKLSSCQRAVKGQPLVWLGAFEAPRALQGLLTGESQERLQIKGLRPSLDLATYAQALTRIKEYIAAGDTYQVNYTFKYRFETPTSPEDLYLVLRRQQRVSYAALIRGAHGAVLSLSPELFLCREGNLLWTAPMKGTVKRGRTLEEDEALSRWLAQDPKNQAENVMIVDLLRHDLGRVCEPGSVYVRELFRVERYETLHQMISIVQGTLPQGVRLEELWAALFPCGSVTGAPKIRTMEIIAELEPEPRGVYTGAVGYLSPTGDFVFNVAIRTLVLTGEQAEFGIGSGVVWDSDPRQEYEECLLKARFLLEERPRFSLVETMRFEPGRGFPLKALHLARLRRSAAYFGFPWEEEALQALLAEVAEGLTQPAKVRVLLAEDGGLTVEAYALADLVTPVTIGLGHRSVTAAEPFLYHKTTHRPWYEEPRKLAQEHGLFEVVFLNEDGELTEGTITNLFLEIEGRLYTPRLEAGLLPGVLREHLLRSGKLREARLTLRDLERAERVFVGNAVRGLLPVASWKWLSTVSFG